MPMRDHKLMRRKILSLKTLSCLYSVIYQRISELSIKSPNVLDPGVGEKEMQKL